MLDKKQVKTIEEYSESTKFINKVLEPETRQLETEISQARIKSIENQVQLG